MLLPIWILNIPNSTSKLKTESQKTPPKSLIKPTNKLLSLRRSLAQRGLDGASWQEMLHRLAPKWSASEHQRGKKLSGEMIVPLA